MVKYGHYLAALDRDSLGFQGKFLQYKRLKKQLRRGGPDDGASTTSPAPPAGAAEPGFAAASQQALDDRFFALLGQEMQRVNGEFMRAAHAIVAAHQSLQLRRRLCCFPRLLAAGPSHLARLAERAYWCRKYARANGVAVRKILKKYDKLRAGRRGRDFLQHCWRLPTGSAFLHSPLLDELKAIQELLHQQRQAQEDIQLCEVAEVRAPASQADGADPRKAPATPEAAAPLHARLHRGSLDGGCCASHSHPDAPATLAAIAESPLCMLSSSDYEWGAEDGGGGVTMLRPSLDASTLGDAPQSASTGASLGASPRDGGPWRREAAGERQAAAGLQRVSPARFQDEELRCPICLDALYKPVGLSCGHRFCKACALEHAGLLPAFYGTFSNLCSYVDSRVACPQCRQPRVYRQARRLRQLDRVLQGRLPEAWEQRRREERARRRDAAETAAGDARIHWRHAVNAHEALLSM